MALSFPASKDPDDVADYQVDWAAFLGTDTITTSTWIVPDGLTKNSDGKSSTATTIWLSGGTGGALYLLVNRIVTAGGRTYDQSVKLKVKDR